MKLSSDQPENGRHRKRGAFGLAVGLSLIIAYLTYGFYPLSPVPSFQNNADINRGAHVIHFPRPGITYTHETQAWLEDTIMYSSLEITLMAKTASTEQDGPARIFSLSRNTALRNLTIGQVGKDLEIRLRRQDSDPNGLPGIIIPGVFNDNAWKKISLKFTGKGLTVKIGGHLMLNQPLSAAPFSTWSPEYGLAIGNEFTFDRPWLGDIRRAEITTRHYHVDFLEPGMLKAPETYFFPTWKQRQTGLSYKQHFSPRLSQDWIVNFLGFIPFGLIFVLLFQPRLSAPLIIIIGMGLSASIETVQLFLPWRHPSLHDWILNSIGTALGVWGGLALRKRKRV